MAIVTWTTVWGAYLGTEPPVGEHFVITLYAEDQKTVLGVLNLPDLTGEARFEVYGVKAGSITIEQGQKMWMQKVTSPPRVRPGEAYAVVLNFEHGY